MYKYLNHITKLHAQIEKKLGFRNLDIELQTRVYEVISFISLYLLVTLYWKLVDHVPRIYVPALQHNYGFMNYKPQT